MAIEAGAKNGIFPFDEVTKEYEEARVEEPYEPVAPDDDAEYVRTVEINLDEYEYWLPEEIVDMEAGERPLSVSGK